MNAPSVAMSSEDTAQTRADDDDATARGTLADPGPSAGPQASGDWIVRRVTGSSRAVRGQHIRVHYLTVSGWWPR